MSFVSLHTHSEYSFYSGIPTIPLLVQRAKALGMTALALTDTNRMSGLIRFYTECKEHGIKPILGVELTDAHNLFEPRLVLLAKNAEGYGDLCEIITRKNLTGSAFSYDACFAQMWDNLICITSCPRMLALLATTPNKKNLYAEIINISSKSRQQGRILASLATNLAVPLVASNNAYFLDDNDFKTHKVLRAIGLTATVSRLTEEEYASPRSYLRNGTDMHKLFPDHPQALINTVTIADACTVKLDLGHWIMPTVALPDNESPASYLRHHAYKGLKTRYEGSQHYEKACELQEHELAVIEKLGYSSYFLIVKDVCDWAGATFAHKYRSPTDATILRGSAANAITFYNLGVSNLDPITNDLYFQRFLNEDRASPPDADLDFGWDERDQALTYLVEKWGRERVAITCTTNHFRKRAALRECALVYGYSEEQVTSLVRSWRKGADHLHDDDIAMLLASAQKILGKPRFLGQHPGGVLISNKPICRHVALEHAPGGTNRLITQIDMHNGIDELGLIKFDILGNGSLSVLRDALSQLAEQDIADPRVSDLDKCYNDPAVQHLISSGKTRGIFYIESPAQIKLNIRANAQTFEEIAITSSLVRPAGTAYAETFVERHRLFKQGIVNWEYLHPSLEPILRESHDVCAYQEDVTKICHQVAGLTFKQADGIRKMMNSLREGSLQSIEYQTLAATFMHGCITTSGLSQEQALTLWERVSSFTGFSFCKSHSASYAQLSFKCSYLKAHYPAQFLAAVISNNHGFYTRDVYLAEARRIGVEIFPITINTSSIAYRGHEKCIHVGLMHIRGIGHATQDALIHERTTNGPFTSILDVAKRVPMHRQAIVNLVLVGAFDTLGLTQPETLFVLDEIYTKHEEHAPSFLPHTTTLADRVPKNLTNYTLMQKCLNELYLLGFMVSGNILAILDMHPKARHAIHAADMVHNVNKRVRVCGWAITNRAHHIAGREATMLFITLEDVSGPIDVVLWPEIYTRYATILGESGPYAICGRITESWGTYCIEAETVEMLEWLPTLIDFEEASHRLHTATTRSTSYEHTLSPVAA